uniref:Ig-like domain-containing protein n=1 Tax=Anopheles dirus TaxID=7168 RepID=A0A182NA31_9DIPT
ELIIEKAIQANTGVYCCIVEDQNGNQKNSTFKLYVRESHEDYVLLREKNNRSEINLHRNANGEVPPIDIVFEYQSYPTSIVYLWTNFSGAATVGRSRKYAVSRTDTHVGLRINEPSVYDTGNYTLRVMAGTASKQHQIRVHVYVEPFVNMESSIEGKLMRMGDEVNFTCRATGFPCPEISFGFRQCENLQSCCNDDMESFSWRLYIDLNNPYLTMNIQKQRNGNVDYLAGQGPPEEYAPAVPDIHKI